MGKRIFDCALVIANLSFAGVGVSFGNYGLAVVNFGVFIWLIAVIMVEELRK
jgi:type IV secretory pathway TrbD component